MIGVTGQRRFRFSIRELMIVVAFCAVVLALVLWTIRQGEARLRLERLAADAARLQAEKALYVAQVRTAQAAFDAVSSGTADPTRIGSEVTSRQGELWAALSANHPVFKDGQTKDLRIELTLVNDGDEVIDPKIVESRIVINGKELADSGLILRSGLQGSQFKALSPGDHLQFGVVLRKHFQEPGTYRVSWKGTRFQSPEIVIRILPDTAH
jgi:hypothetical protein